MRFDIVETLKSFRVGFSTSIQYIYQMIFLIIVNNVLGRIAGENGIAVFDLLQNASYLILYLFEGIVKTMQPLISSFCGEHNESGKRETFNLAIGFGIGIGGVAILAVAIFPEILCTLFGLGMGSAAELGKFALRLYSIGALFAGLSTLIEGYYQAVELEKNAFVLATLRGFAVLLPCTVLFSFAGIEFFWLIFPVVEIISLLLFFVWKHFRGENESQIDHDRVFSKIIVSNNEELALLIERVEEFCEGWGANAKQIYFVSMSIEEICVAIMQKAFKTTLRGYIQITLIAMENGEFELHIRDNAVKFNPFLLHTGKIGSDEEFDPDAMGMMMIKQKAKFFFYRQYQGFNTLILKI